MVRLEKPFTVEEREGGESGVGDKDDLDVDEVVAL
jgi:hypothetical protein